MINPRKITNFNLNIPQLQEHLLWWICAAGKNGVVAARCLENLLNQLDAKKEPFEALRKCSRKQIENAMKFCGIGDYKKKSRAFVELVNANLDLKTCSREELVKIHGIGYKTASCFLIHSRPNQQMAGLDRHILKWMKKQGCDVPTSTPSKKRYLEIEKEYLKIRPKESTAEADLSLWLQGRE